MKARLIGGPLHGIVTEIPEDERSALQFPIPSLLIGNDSTIGIDSKIGMETAFYVGHRYWFAFDPTPLGIGPATEKEMDVRPGEKRKAWVVTIWSFGDAHHGYLDSAFGLLNRALEEIREVLAT